MPSQGACKQQIALAAVPLASDPSNAVQQTECRSLGDDQVLGPFAIELDQVAPVDAEVRYLRQKRLDGNDSRAGPIVMGHHSKTTHVRADFEDGSDVVGSQVDANAVTLVRYTDRCTNPTACEYYACTLAIVFHPTAIRPFSLKLRLVTNSHSSSMISSRRLIASGDISRLVPRDRDLNVSTWVLGYLFIIHHPAVARLQYQQHLGGFGSFSGWD